MGMGEIQLKFTSGCVVNLKVVRYVHAIREILVSDYLLDKADFKQVIEADQFLLSKVGAFL